MQVSKILHFVWLFFCLPGYGSVVKNDLVRDSFSNFEVSSAYSVAPITREAFSTKLRLIVQSSSKWTEKEVLHVIRSAEKILSQCKISFSSIDLVYAENEELDSVTCKTDYLVTKKLTQPSNSSRVTQTLTAFLVEELKCWYSDVGWANRMRGGDHDFEHFSTNSTFFSHQGLKKLSRQTRMDKFAYILAHELGHILQLINDGHVRYPNIMSMWPMQAILEFTPEQCREMQTHPLFGK